LLTPAQLHLAQRGPLLVARSRRGSVEVRLFAEPVVAQGRRLVIVVGSSLASRDAALGQLRNELLIGGPVALLLASLIGYLVAAAALRPVERMRAQAAAISAQRVSARLAIAPSGDEVSRLGETLNAMLARLEEALVRERSFVADASHELRTPLALLRAEIELALESPRTRSELEAALRSAGDETDRLCQLAEDLLLLARLDHGVLPVRLETVELDDVLDGVAARFERRARDAGRSIESDGGGIRVDADRLRLEQAIGNLVENALRYGSGSVRLHAAARLAGVEIHVTDEGSGFPAGFLSNAFERFARADESRGGGGAGLGLTIVRAVAEAHGGTAVAANGDDGGADVWLSLPGSSVRPPRTLSRVGQAL
jgi:heavy metal sensor kinase